MSELSKAIASKEAGIAKLQGEIEVLRRAESILAPAGAAEKTAAPKARAMGNRQRMSAAQKRAVSERMKAYWAKRNRKKTAKKAPAPKAKAAKKRRKMTAAEKKAVSLRMKASWAKRKKAQKKSGK